MTSLQIQNRISAYRGILQKVPGLRKTLLDPNIPMSNDHFHHKKEVLGHCLESLDVAERELIEGNVASAIERAAEVRGCLLAYSQFTHGELLNPRHILEELRETA